MATSQEDWHRLLGELQQGMKQKLSGLDQMQDYARSNPVSREQLSGLLDVSGQLLGDNNFKVALRTMQVWETVVQNEADSAKPFVTNLLPFVVERLGDNHQEVRQAACNLMLEVLQCQVLRPQAMNDRLARFWAHKAWKVRHGLLQFVAEAVCMLGEPALATRDSADPHGVVAHVLRLVEDPESAVRDAAIECLEEVYGVVGEALVDAIARAGLRPAQLREVYARLGAAAAASASDAAGGQDAAAGHDTASSSWPADQQQQQQQYSSPPARAAGGAKPKTLDAGPSHRGGDDSCPSSPAVSDQHASPTRVPAAKQQQQQQRGRAGASAAAAPAPARRGGYKDGGGVGVSGELPDAQAVYVGSERELRAELDKAASVFAAGAAAADWQQRVGVLLRLEGLVKGGAAEGALVDAFDEGLRPLRDAVGEQLLDRRSAVSRQACHVLTVLSNALGRRFDAFAAAIVPNLFKSLVITVAVVAEAADACTHVLVANHHHPKIAAVIADALANDKNPKLRQYCSVYLLQALEAWAPDDYAAHEDRVEAALARALGDNLTATRAAAREAFCAYRAAAPARAAALLRRLDGSAQLKLKSAAADYVPGAFLARAGVAGAGGAASAASSRPGSRAESAAPSRAASGALDRPASAASTHARKPAARVTGAGAAPTAAAAAAPAVAAVNELAAGAQRVPMPAGAANSHAAAAATAAASLASSAQRVSTVDGLPYGHHQQQEHNSSRQHSAALDELDRLNLGAAAPHAAPPTPGHVPPRTPGGGMSGGGTRGALARALAALAAPGGDWRERVQRLDALSEALAAPGAVAGAGELADVERALPRLLACADDGHFRVSLAGLGAVDAALRAAPAALEPALDRLLPALFARLVAPKEPCRAAAEVALQTCAASFAADALVPALVRALDAVKQPAARVSVMEFAVLFVGDGKAAGAPSPSMHLKQWVARLLPLLLDRTPGVRRMAARALARLHAADASFVDACAAHADAREQQALRRALAAAAAGGGDDDEGGGSRPGSPATAAGGSDDGHHHLHLHQQQQQHYHHHHSDLHDSATAGIAKPSSSNGAPSATTTTTAAPHDAAPPPPHAGPTGRDILGRTFLAPLEPAQRAPPPPRAALPVGAAARRAHLDALAARLEARATEDALAELAACVACDDGGGEDGVDGDADSAAWDAVFGRGLLAALAAARHASDATRAAAFALVRALAERRAARFAPSLAVALPPLLLGCADPCREALAGAHAALEALIGGCDALAVLGVLRLKLPSDEAVQSGTAADGDVLCAAIRCVQRAAARLPPATLLDVAPAQLLPGLFAAFAHPKPEVRKVVVFCLAELWLRAGSGLEPHLGQLSASQQKLLAIYRARAEAAAAAAAGRA